MSITSARDICTIRYSDTGEVTTTHSVNLRVAKWAEMRGNKPPTGKVPPISSEAPTRIVRRLRTDIPDQ